VIHHLLYTPEPAAVRTARMAAPGSPGAVRLRASRPSPRATRSGRTCEVQRGTGVAVGRTPVATPFLQAHRSCAWPRPASRPLSGLTSSLRPRRCTGTYECRERTGCPERPYLRCTGKYRCRVRTGCPKWPFYIPAGASLPRFPAPRCTCIPVGKKGVCGLPHTPFVLQRHPQVPS
jgi:hypothetical protein